MGLLGRIIGHGVQQAVAAESKARERDPVRWLITRGIVFVILVIGWTFIVWQNKFHITAPTFFVCVGYLAVVMTIVNLWRTGAAAMSTEDLGEWARPQGERGELEREKRTLLKAIKEAEFDHEMGKLSKADADAMIQMYRARAIEVIKQLEQFENIDMNVDPAGRPLGQLSVRDQIAREVKLRLELAQAAKPKKKQKAGKAEEPEAEAKAEEPKPEPKVEAKAEEPKPEPKVEAKAEEPAVEPAPEESKADSASEATS